MAVMALHLTESSSLPFDKCFSFQSLAHRSLPVWKSGWWCICCPGVRLWSWHLQFLCFWTLTPSTCALRFRLDHLGSSSAEKGNLSCRSCQMNQWLLLLALGGITHTCPFIVWDPDEMTAHHVTSALLSSWLQLQLPLFSWGIYGVEYCSLHSLNKYLCIAIIWEGKEWLVWSWHISPTP